MSFPSSLARVCLLGGAGAVVATAAWAVPSDSEPQLIERAAAVEAPAAPEVDLPAVGESSQEAAPATAVVAAPAAAAAPTDLAPTDAAPADTVPPHLDPEPEEHTDPVIVSTTTTPPPTTTAAPAPKPAPTTTAAPDVTVAFSASQKYGSCGEAVPYDIFSGTATPGSTITISSPYGSGTTTADVEGRWSRKVEFPNAPAHETFSVSVNGLGGSKSFSFTATGEARA